MYLYLLCSETIPPNSNMCSCCTSSFLFAILFAYLCIIFSSAVTSLNTACLFKSSVPQMTLCSSYFYQYSLCFATTYEINLNWLVKQNHDMRIIQHIEKLYLLIMLSFSSVSFLSCAKILNIHDRSVSTFVEVLKGIACPRLMNQYVHCLAFTPHTIVKINITFLNGGNTSKLP